MIRLIPQAELEAIAGEEYRQRFKPAAGTASVHNLGNALALVEPDALTWRGDVYPVRLIAWAEGLKLQRIAMEMERLQTRTTSTLEDIEDLSRFADTVLSLFHSILTPRPPENPFLSATPVEVGELLGFFSVCLMRQSERASVRMARPSRSIM
jgi:hypothetical protein